jgi:hypothetical protein
MSVATRSEEAQRMESEVILRIVVLIAALGIVHWGLVPVALENLFSRQRVVGGHKGLWGILIVCLTCVGSLSYLMIHPAEEKETAPEREGYWERYRED